MPNLSSAPDRSGSLFWEARLGPTRKALDRLRRELLCERTIEGDPVRIVRDYPDAADREVVGLFCALLAYGRVEPMIDHIRAFLAPLGENPAQRLRDGIPKLPPLSYRFHRTADLRALLRGTRRLLLRHGDLGNAFVRHWRTEESLRGGLIRFASELKGESGRAGRGFRFLIPDPALGGACKRWHLFLRWMVRSAPNDPDLGLWRDRVPSSILLIPLDTHLVRVSRRLGWTRRRTVDWKMAEEVTAVLRRICPADPVRYDFPLCHLGITGGCPPHRTAADCIRCPMKEICRTACEDHAVASLAAGPARRRDAALREWCLERPASGD